MTHFKHSVLELTAWERQCLEDSELKDVYRTAPATQGLLMMVKDVVQVSGHHMGQISCKDSYPLDYNHLTMQ